MAFSPGATLGHYEVSALIGEGGMGQVWQATDTQLHRQVVRKVSPTSTPRCAGQILIGLALVLLAQGTAYGQESARVVESMRTAYATAQVEWQRGLAELVVEGKPDLAGIATLQRDLQLAFIELRTARFEYLLDRELSRLVLTQRLSALMNFAWSEEDTETFRNADPRHAVLEDRVTILRQRNDNHPDWSVLRQYFRTDLAQGSEYQALLRAFTARQEAVSAMLDEHTR